MAIIINENKIKELYECGNSMKKISLMAGCNYRTIRCKLKKMDVKIRDNSRQDFTNLQIKNLYESGMNGREISQELKAGHSTISNRLKKMGLKSKKQMSTGENHPGWKGGRSKTGKGYILIKAKDYPVYRQDGYVLEHIYVWEKIHNRKVPKNWIIHHLNGIKDDNRPENLIAMENKKHHQLTEPYKKRIRELELEITKLKQLPLFLIN